MDDSLTRKDFLRTLALVGGSVGLQACGDTAARAEAPGADIVAPGNLWRVRSARGVRAGGDGNRGASFSASRTSFEAGDAYSVLGEWYFFYDAGGILGAIRNCVTAKRRIPVTYSVVGVRTDSGSRFASSIGVIQFSRSSRDEVQCEVVANNFYVDAGGRGISPYFISSQVLDAAVPADLSAEARERISLEIEATVDRLGLDPGSVVYPTS